MPQLEGVLETALYVDDKPRSVAFFRDVMGMTIVRDEDRLTAFDAGGQSILLVFARQASLDGEDTPGGHIPGHDGAGPLHMAFKVAAGDYEAWRDHLRSAAVPELSEVTWPTGGRSYYFNDPDGHVLEIATPGLWPSY
ncbi:catechol 2,3-dioxygenase-like lactoylglutathione lyase family enzyme [Sphingomonas sp. SORGH_AS802]|jgi:catechol 2,3-dioxygenase-like lactoylglutathione lyase family enzyme|uniref:VOC family protein n=1 Tax=unclassified Sphingomonas TaxID=196159 RepID=UPI0028642402|nr:MULTISPECIES: VOC family protein [unclassified Sphingomonas]MDR6126859.1 catechol 2,3-dioxygenase-like lactoylglutathione lyase family enzyme [Sphingomonas sp. SORGH_AS_0438]MDR6134779.1 catechol 2,3-dioxygenase-like lactoylglutathione lyase family enzyme [Sphingomonas sp. SORGH_AS_0802]